MGENEKTESSHEDLMMALEQRKFVALHRISEKFLENDMGGVDVNLHYRLDWFWDENDIVEMLKGRIWAHADGEYEFKWYASWWQELRERILPSWWLIRFPSRREIKKRIKAFSTYPSFKYVGVAHKAVLIFEEQK